MSDKLENILDVEQPLTSQRLLSASCRSPQAKPSSSSLVPVESLILEFFKTGSHVAQGGLEFTV